MAGELIRLRLTTARRVVDGSSNSPVPAARLYFLWAGFSKCDLAQGVVEGQAADLDEEVDGVQRAGERSRISGRPAASASAFCSSSKERKPSAATSRAMALVFEGTQKGRAVELGRVRVADGTFLRQLPGHARAGAFWRGELGVPVRWGRYCFHAG
jgi:hypothetical protein